MASGPASAMRVQSSRLWRRSGGRESVVFSRAHTSPEGTGTGDGTGELERWSRVPGAGTDLCTGRVPVCVVSITACSLYVRTTSVSTSDGVTTS
jgi:hypothetical protein